MATEHCVSFPAELVLLASVLLFLGAVGPVPLVKFPSLGNIIPVDGIAGEASGVSAVVLVPFVPGVEGEGVGAGSGAGAGAGDLPGAGAGAGAGDLPGAGAGAGAGVGAGAGAGAPRTLITPCIPDLQCPGIEQKNEWLPSSSKVTDPDELTSNPPLGLHPDPSVTVCGEALKSNRTESPTAIVSELGLKRSWPPGATCIVCCAAITSTGEKIISLGFMS